MPNPPKNLAATKQDYRMVLLSWEVPDPSTPSVSSYEVQRKTGAGSFTTISPPIAWLNYTDHNVLPDTQYTYQVIARDYAGAVSQPSNQKVVVMNKITTPISVNSADGPGASLSVSWDSNGDGSLSFEVERQRTDSGSFPWETAATPTGYVLTAYDMSTPIGQSFQHRVRAKKQINSTWYFSDYSTASTARLSTFPQKVQSAFASLGIASSVAESFLARNIPNVIPNIDAVSYRHVRLEWNHKEDIKKYTVVKYKVEDTRPRRVTTSIPATGYSDGDPVIHDDFGALEPLKEYAYEVTADPPLLTFQPVKTKVPDALEQPTDILLYDNGGRKLQIRWKHPHSTEGGGDAGILWKIQRFIDGEAGAKKTWDNVPIVPNTGVYEYDDPDALVTRTVYYYKIVAKKPGLQSSSAAVSPTRAAP